MRKILSSLILLSVIITGGCSDNTSINPPQENVENPRLIVTIVVDQMRYNYLNKFQGDFDDDGFNKLRHDGFSFSNTHHSYFPTVTGVGHASIFTGATPSVHGIVANNWYDRKRDRNMYCVADGSVRGVGGSGSSGHRSPQNLISSTFTDELKKASPESRVVTMSLKDRGAVLPAGHLGDVALWYDDSEGDFMSSTWYMQDLPTWTKRFNENGRAEELCGKNWKTAGSSLSATRDCYSNLKRSPYGNTLLKELAFEAVEAENLGEDRNVDVLSISFSATDYIGHSYGPQSDEVRKTYNKLDDEIANLINFLDEEVGNDQYLLVLTSDHGVAKVPGPQLDRTYPGGYFNSGAATNELENYLDEEYGDGKWIRNYSNQQIFLNRSLIRSKDLKVNEIQDESARFLEQKDNISAVNTAHDFATQGYNGNSVRAMYQKGFYPKRSGDIYLRLDPGWVDSKYKPGTSHGSVYDYDTHVPLLFYGWNVPAGSTTHKTGTPQIAPTISHIIGIPYPSGTESNILPLDM